MELLEIGKIVGTHGVRGELRVEPWCDNPAFLAGFTSVYISGQPQKVISARPHKSLVLMMLEGVDTVEAAQALRGTVLHIDRTGVELPEGRYFIQDLVGLSVRRTAGGDGTCGCETGEHIGTLYDVLTAPAHDVYVVRGEDGDRMIPVVPEFVKKIDIDAGVIWVELIEGM